MPLAKYKKYLLRFSLPDGEHLAVIDAPEVVDEASAQLVTNHAHAALSQNRDYKLGDIEPLNSILDVQKHVEELKARNPNRPLAHELGLDTPNRILTNPEIPRGLAAMYNAGDERDLRQLTPGEIVSQARTIGAESLAAEGDAPAPGGGGKGEAGGRVPG